MRTATLLMASLLGCGGAEASYPGLPGYMKVAAILPVRPDRVLVAGHFVPSGGLGPIEAREPRIFAFERGPATVAWGEGQGWMIAAAQRVGEVWAVRARLRPEGEGSLYNLLVSSDFGVSWSDHGPIPAQSITSVSLAGGGVGWVHGAHNLWRTADGGANWTAVSAPGIRDSSREHILADGPLTAWLAGPALLRTEDGGATWRVLESDGVEITDGRFVVGHVANGMRVGRLGPGGIRWGATWSGDLLARYLASDGERLTVLASHTGRDVGSGPVLLRSRDGGQTLVAEQVRGPSDANSYALAGPDGLLWVDQGRKLRVRVPAGGP